MVPRLQVHRRQGSGSPNSERFQCTELSLRAYQDLPEPLQELWLSPRKNAHTGVLTIGYALHRVHDTEVRATFTAAAIADQVAAVWSVWVVE